MTPYALEKAVSDAQEAAKKEPQQIQNIIFHLLTVLIRHDADKEARVNLRAVWDGDQFRPLDHSALSNGDRA